MGTWDGGSSMHAVGQMSYCKLVIIYTEEPVFSFAEVVAEIVDFTVEVWNSCTEGQPRIPCCQVVNDFQSPHANDRQINPPSLRLYHLKS